MNCNYQEIATGIVKNPELYNFYYDYCIDKLSPGDNESETYGRSFMISSIITRLYKNSSIKGKNVLNLFDYLDNISKEDNSGEKIGQMLVDMLRLLVCTDYKYVSTPMGALWRTIGFLENPKELTLRELKKHARRAKKASILTKRQADRLKKRYRGTPIENDLDDIISESLREVNKKEIDTILDKYDLGNDPRIKTSKYQTILEPYFKEAQYRFIIESILDAPDIAEKAYSYALSNIDKEILLQSAEPESKTRTNALVLLTRLREKYSMLYKIAASHDSDPEALGKMLKLASQKKEEEENNERNVQNTMD